MVFLQHYVLSRVPSLWQWGWAGVDVFFVLSGFLITGILFDTKEDMHRFRNFYIRRTLRIFPLYYGVLLLILLLTPIMRWNWNSTWICWSVYLGNYVRFLFVQRFVQSGGMLETLQSPVIFQGLPIRIFLGHFWSLGVEEQFYFLWPLIVFSVKDRIKLRNICLAVVLVLPFIRLIAAMKLPRVLVDMEILYRSTPFRIDALLLGGLAALLMRGPERQYLNWFAPKLAIGCVALLIAGLLLPQEILHRPVLFGTTSVLMSSFGFSIIDLLTACIILISLDPNSSVFRLLAVKPLRRLGEISYGFYVFHDIPHVLYILIARWIVGKNYLAEFALSVLIAFVCTLGMASLCYRYFELPFLRLKDRYAPS